MSGGCRRPRPAEVVEEVLQQEQEVRAYESAEIPKDLTLCLLLPADEGVDTINQLRHLLQ